MVSSRRTATSTSSPANCSLLAVDALVAEAVCRERRGVARLDLAGVGFVGVAATLLPPLELVIRHPPAMLARIVDIGCGPVTGLRFGLSKAQADTGVQAAMELQR